MPQYTIGFISILFFTTVALSFRHWWVQRQKRQRREYLRQRLQLSVRER